ncbi:hypothetical protein GVN18_24965 [Pseudomonas sp. ODNR1LW]|nr:hypothetical protein [Pseudomonas sp. ODNR1LW]
MHNSLCRSWLASEAIDLAVALALAFDLAVALALAFDLAVALALAFDLAVALALAFDLDLPAPFPEAERRRCAVGIPAWMPG